MSRMPLPTLRRAAELEGALDGERRQCFGERRLRLVPLRAAVAVVAALVLLVGPSAAAFAESPSQATAARVETDAKTTRFELDLTRGVTAEVFTLANPYRVIVDLPDVGFQLKPGTGQESRGLVSAFRYGLFAERKGRVVIDTAGPVKIQSARMSRIDGGGVALKITLEPMDAAAFGAGTGAQQNAPTAETREAREDRAAPAPKEKTKPVIVIDPGHGGIDPGATGVNNATEKAIVLAVALAMKSVLGETGRYDIRLTRASDVFISLDRRLKFSADAEADLFISLHADSIEEKALAENIRGATIYTLSEKASDEQARLKAEKENASDLIAGLENVDQSGKDQVKNILIDLMKRENSNFSADFSNVVAGKLGKATPMSRDPQRSAAFKVLKQSHAPSVLIELGYMSNSRDQSQMATPQWQKQVATSIAAAVQAYFGKRTAEHP
jgi:N-acetylmuramoyl-L-alanine amidase